MISPQQRITLPSGIELSYLCWNPDDDKPPLLLLHGTSFVAATFNPLAEQLTSHFRVYAYDRRGHGLSSKPASGYEFMDFAEDCIAFCEALDLKNTYALGHSAGGTDMLIAQSIKNTLFEKIFALEPTLSAKNDIPVEEKILIRNKIENSVQSGAKAFVKRRGVFPNRERLLSIYKTKPVFKTWQEEVLKVYIDTGFKDRDDGQVELQCGSEIETQILEKILFAFQDAYVGDERGDPFQALPAISCPLLISSSECSDPIYQSIAPKAAVMFPNARSMVFPGLNHCAPQESPEAVAKAALAFFLEG